MAKYIMSILKGQLMVVWSWGFNSPVTIENGLRFKVQGFKFKGAVEIVYNEGKDLFNINFIKNGKVSDTIEDVYFDMLVEAIDTRVEKTANYEQRVLNEYSLN
ncbi:hypothetical protein [Bacteroides sp. UBA939]|uniref:hypothetical protein n=1 Tax=Bacteroides sp. UBA939 TaxID=1946092 RepID=UPI0025C22D66|nr:hypothetical protein [Bacteroides sp. UBA939]